MTIEASTGGIVGYGRWQAYAWKNELAVHSERVILHFREYLDEDFNGEHSPFDMFERALVLSGFVIRRMMETHVVTDKLRESKIIVRCLPAECTEAFLKPWASDTGPRRARQYNFEEPGSVQMSIRELGNEIIHSQQLAINYGFERSEDGILIASDYHYKKRLLHVTPQEFKAIAGRVLADEVRVSVDGYEGHEPGGRIISIRE